MGFKLGRAKAVTATGGVLKSKLSFKKHPSSIPGNAIIRKDLPDDIIAEANSPAHGKDANTIYLNKKIDPNSELAKDALKHEMIHLTAMKISPGKLSYTDNSITYEGRDYPRKDINGKDMIMDVNTGEWKEAGSEEWPWEKDANEIMNYKKS
tara:strand:+ start:278 stop:733 length:456 start_codon:yes stop_codon:yes gene_type:complete